MLKPIGVEKIEEDNREVGIIAGTVTVTSAGTPVQVTRSGWNIKAVTFKAKEGNAGSVYIGGGDVSSSNGFELSPGSYHEFVFPTQGKLSWYHVDASNDNDELDYMVMSV